MIVFKIFNIAKVAVGRYEDSGGCSNGGDCYMTCLQYFSNLLIHISSCKVIASYNIVKGILLMHWTLVSILILKRQQGGQL